MRAEAHAVPCMNAMMACFGKWRVPLKPCARRMGQPALVVVFEDRPGLDGETKFGAPLGLPVGAHVVAEAVRQHPGGDERIDRNRLGEGGGLRRGCRGRLLRGEGGRRRADKRDDAERAGVQSKTHAPLSPVFGTSAFAASTVIWRASQSAATSASPSSSVRRRRASGQAPPSSPETRTDGGSSLPDPHDRRVAHQAIP